MGEGHRVQGSGVRDQSFEFRVSGLKQRLAADLRGLRGFLSFGENSGSGVERETGRVLRLGHAASVRITATKEKGRELVPRPFSLDYKFSISY